MPPREDNARVFLISGGSRGLGRGLVSRCLDEGHRVATFSRSSTPFIEARQDEDPAGERFCWESVDGTDRDAVKGFVKRVTRRFGRIDVLVNNAAVGIDGLLALTPLPEIERGVDANLTSVLHLTQLCTKVMLRQRQGCIIHLSSVHAIRGHAGVSVYSATKAALDGVTRSLARELGPRDIRVNAVAPGYFESDMVAGLGEEQRARIARRTPLGRLAHIDEIVGAVLFLASPQASFITGHTLVVDGGITC